MGSCKMEGTVRGIKAHSVSCGLAGSCMERRSRMAAPPADARSLPAQRVPDLALMLPRTEMAKGPFLLRALLLAADPASLPADRAVMPPSRTAMSSSSGTGCSPAAGSCCCVAGGLLMTERPLYLTRHTALDSSEIETGLLGLNRKVFCTRTTHLKGFVGQLARTLLLLLPPPLPAVPLPEGAWLDTALPPRLPRGTFFWPRSRAATLSAARAHCREGTLWRCFRPSRRTRSRAPCSGEGVTVMCDSQSLACSSKSDIHSCSHATKLSHPVLLYISIALHFSLTACGHPNTLIQTGEPGSPGASSRPSFALRRRLKRILGVPSL